MIATVLGTAVGSAATLGAACLAFAGARRQTRDQGRVDHRLRLRDERKQAYLAFVEEAEQLIDRYRAACETVRLYESLRTDDVSEPDWFHFEQRAEALVADLDKLSPLRTRITLTGPQDVDEGAARLCDALSAAAHYVTEVDHDHDQVVGAEQRAVLIMQDVDAAREKFTDAVRGVLVVPPL